MSMVKRFLIIESALRDAQENIVKEKFKIFGERPGDPITPAEKGLMRSLISVLDHTENATCLLRRNTEPTIINVDVFTSGIIRNLKSLIKQEQVESCNILLTYCTWLPYYFVYMNQVRWKPCAII